MGDILMCVKKISKDELIEILDGMNLQIIWIKLCIDELEALKEIGKERLKVASNFIYITHSSLIYRYSMELAKLFDNTGDAYSITSVCNLCSQNKEFFNDTGIVEFCRSFRSRLNEYKDLTDNIHSRRSKTYAHNDRQYYLFKKKALEDFPIDMNIVKELVGILYYGVYQLGKGIGSKRIELGYPSYTDDVKRLFGMKTNDDKWLENADEDFK